MKIGEHIRDQSNAARALNRTIDKAKQFVNNSKLFEMNDKHAVLPIGGKTRVATWGEDPELPGRWTIVICHVLRLQGAARQIPFHHVEGEAEEVRLDSWWIGHPHRRQYDNGMQSTGPTPMRVTNPPRAETHFLGLALDLNGEPVLVLQRLESRRTWQTSQWSSDPAIPDLRPMWRPCVLPPMGRTACFSFISNSFEFSTNCFALSMVRLRARATLLWSRMCSPIFHRIRREAMISSAIPALTHSALNAITARLRSPLYFSAMPVPSWPSSIHFALSPVSRGSSGSMFSNSSVALKLAQSRYRCCRYH